VKGHHLTLVRWLEKTLQIRRGEWRGLLRLWWGYIMLSLGVEAARLVAEILFVSRAGIHWLPSLFIFQAVVNTAASTGYLALIHRTRIPQRNLLAGLLFLFGGSTAVLSVLTGWMGKFWVYGLLFGCVEAGAVMLKIHWGVHILELYSPRSASRVFPFLFTGSAVGRSIGGAAIRQGAHLLGLAHLLMVILAFSMPLAMVLLYRKKQGESFDDAPPRPPADAPPHSIPKTAPEPAAQFLLTPKSPCPYDRKATKRPEKSDLAQDEAIDFSKGPPQQVGTLSSGQMLGGGVSRGILTALKVSLRSPLLRAMAVSTVLMVLVRHTMRYTSLAVFKHALDETALAGLLGTYTLMANLVALGLQLVIAPRFFRRLGIQAANLLYAVSLVGSLIALALSGQLWAAVSMRFFHTEFKSSMRTPASPIFYFGEPPERRAQARAFILGVIVPASTVLAGLALQGAQSCFDLATIAWAGGGLALFYVAACFWQNRAYTRGIAKLRVGDTDKQR
jgi:hypothetical protein